MPANSPPDQTAQAVRDRVDLLALVGTRVALKRSGDWAVGLCPFHQERNPSFAVSASRRRFECFGCGAKGDCFDWVMRTEGVDFRAALARLAADTGLEGFGRFRARIAPRPPDKAPVDDAGRTEAARAIWDVSVPIAGTQGEAYFRARGITAALPATLRFHPALRHGPSGLRLPAVVAAVRRADRAITAVWRLYLDPARPAKAAVTPNKMGLGPVGGAWVQLSPARPVQAVAEGIETAMAVLQAEPGWCVGAALSAGGFRGFPVLPGVQTVVFACDADRASTEAATFRAMALREAGVKALIRVPDGPKGTDFNDLLMRAA